jgi:1,4-alpha-glucan branching enzyme
MKKIQFLLLLAIAFGLFSCSSKDDVENPIIEEPTGYTQYGTPFSPIPNTEDIIMYEVNMRAFGTNSQFQNVINRLDEIKSLGINTIWLMPIYPIGSINSVNSPYCVKNYKEVSSEYGNLTSLRELTSQAHQKGMTVILDWVANHTSWDNPWITAHSDWYTKNSSGQIIHPAGTNWTDVADLNFDNQAMRLEMIDAMKYWVLEANVDGFRCDYADGVPFEFWQQAISSLNTIPNRDLIFLAEGDRADHFTAGFQMNYAWDFYNRIRYVFNLEEDANNLLIINTLEYNNVPQGKHKLRFTTNHDETAWNATPMTLFNGKDGALAASVATIFINGVPLFYTGQEVGRQSTVSFFNNSPIDWNTNPDMFTGYKNIMNFYKTSDASKKGALDNYSTNHIISFKKTFGSEEILILDNLRNSSKTYSIPTSLQNTTWTNALTNTTVTLNTTINLNAYQYLILKN